MLRQLISEGRAYLGRTEIGPRVERGLIREKCPDEIHSDTPTDIVLATKVEDLDAIQKHLETPFNENPKKIEEILFIADAKHRPQPIEGFQQQMYAFSPKDMVTPIYYRNAIQAAMHDPKTRVTTAIAPNQVALDFAKELRGAEQKLAEKFVFKYDLENQHKPKRPNQ